MVVVAEVGVDLVGGPSSDGGGARGEESTRLAEKRRVGRKAERTSINFWVLSTSPCLALCT